MPSVLLRPSSFLVSITLPVFFISEIPYSDVVLYTGFMCRLDLADSDASKIYRYPIVLGHRSRSPAEETLACAAQSHNAQPTWLSKAFALRCMFSKL